jgi:hypothetical protein
MQIRTLFRIIENAKRSWEDIKSELGTDAESQAFLSQSHLVLANRSAQIELQELEGNISSAITGNPLLLNRTKANPNLMRLCRKLESSQCLQNCSLDLPSLDLADVLHIEVRFPTLNIDLIQRIKGHRLVDSSKTDKSRSNINIVLKY